MINPLVQNFEQNWLQKFTPEHQQNFLLGSFHETYAPIIMNF